MFCFHCFTSAVDITPEMSQKCNVDNRQPNITTLEPEKSFNLFRVLEHFHYRICPYFPNMPFQNYKQFSSIFRAWPYQQINITITFHFSSSCQAEVDYKRIHIEHKTILQLGTLSFLKSAPPVVWPLFLVQKFKIFNITAYGNIQSSQKKYSCH